MPGVSPIPSNPFHIARAYGVQAPMPPRPVVAPIAAESGPVGSIKPPTATSRLAAAVVPGKIAFSGSEPSQMGAALPMYRHPADKNAAATALTAGRTIDVEG